MAPISLPLTPPPVSAYLFYLYPLSILSTGTSHLPWLYSSFGQLFRQPGGELKFYHHPHSTTHSTRDAYTTTCPCLDIQTLDQDLVARGPEGIVSFATRCLREAIYVQVDVDFYHIPRRPQYHRHHFLHEILLSGVDPARQAFEATGYGDTGRPATTWLAYEDLERGVATPRDDLLRDATANGRPELDWLRESLAGRPLLVLYRHRPHISCELDLHLLAEQLSDYLEARNSSERYRLLAPPASTLWGLDVYLYLEDILGNPSRCSDGLAIPFRVLWEHKTLMLSRVRWLRRHSEVRIDVEVAAILEQVAARLHSLRLVLLRWEETRRPEALRRCIELLREAREVEREALSKLLGEVERAAA